MNIDISIIIVNYNCGDYLPNCIKSIYDKAKGVAFEIIIVDNKSSDNSLSTIRQLFPRVIIIENEQNIGFGAANNVGAKVACGDYLLLLNPDTIMLNNALAILYNFAKQMPTNVGALGGNLLDEQLKNANIGGNFPSLFQLFSDIGFRSFYKKLYYKQVSLMMTISNLPKSNEIDSICGADLFIKKDVFNSVGGFDEDFFLYFEDTDLCYRLKKLGLCSVIVPEAEIQHLESAAIADNRTDKLNLRKFTFFEKSKQIFFKKAYGKSSVFISRIFTVTYLFTRWIAHKGNIKEYYKMGCVVFNTKSR